MIRVFLGIVSLSLFTVSNVPSANAGALWSLSSEGGLVWDIPAMKRFPWNPEKGNIGNMGNDGLKYKINEIPPQVQKDPAPATEADLAYKIWNNLGVIPSVRINMKPDSGTNPNSSVTWADEFKIPWSPGDLGITKSDPGIFGDRNIFLNLDFVVRSDRWNYFRNQSYQGMQWDTFTITTHEVGHVIGLGHPSSKIQVMTDGFESRTAGLIKSVEKETPFVNQPKIINTSGIPEEMLADKTKTYKDPHASLQFGDALGAITLYSAPVSWFTHFLSDLTSTSARYNYRVDNNSAHAGDLRSAYAQHTFSIPVDPAVPVTSYNAFFSNPTVGDYDYTFLRDSSGVHLKILYPDKYLKPGETLEFSFVSSPDFTVKLPSTRWAISDIDTSSVAAGFDVNDFSIGGGSYTYYFDGSLDQWQITPFSDVATPVPGGIPFLFLPISVGWCRKLKQRIQTAKQNKIKA